MSKKNTPIRDVIIVGAGASGMMAAITAARRGKRVLLLEHMDKPGKKLLATGNGRCNFTNERMTSDGFYGNPALLTAVLERFGKEDTLAFFREIGIYPKQKNGYYYPNSMQAASVTEALVAELHRCKVELVTGCKVQKLTPRAFGFAVDTSTERYQGRNIILATGLRAAPKLGSDGSMLSVIKELGHRFVPILPSLCGFYAEGMSFAKVAGVRCDARLTLLVDGQETKRERGELQLTDYGISGIPVFQLSSPGARALHEKRKVCVQIDFLPDFTPELLQEELHRRLQRDDSYRSVAASLCGLLHQKLIPVVLTRANIPVNRDAGSIDERAVQRLVDAITGFAVQLLKVRDFSCAQVCTGGVRTEELDIDTLESKLVPGLYFAGELLDIDGICGGYNLQWAWASGYVAGSVVE